MLVMSLYGDVWGERQPRTPTLLSTAGIGQMLSVLTSR